MSGCCSVPPNRKTFNVESYHDTRLARLAISGMASPDSSERITNSLLDVKGVVGVKVNQTLGLADVTFNPDQIAPPALLEAVARASRDGEYQYQARLLNGAEL